MSTFSVVRTSGFSVLSAASEALAASSAAVFSVAGLFASEA